MVFFSITKDNGFSIENITSLDGSAVLLKR